MKKNKQGNYEPNNIEELLEVIRLRHQMYADSAGMLGGIITGFSIAKPASNDDLFTGFQRFLAKKLNFNPEYYGWIEMIQLVSSDREYEVSMFFKFWDEYTGMKIKEIAEVELSWDQRRFDFDRRISFENIDKPKLPLKAPHKIVAIKLPNENFHALYFDSEGDRYYEQGLNTFERLLKWGEDCYDISEDEWIKIK